MMQSNADLPPITSHALYIDADDEHTVRKILKDDFWKDSPLLSTPHRTIVQTEDVQWRGFVTVSPSDLTAVLAAVHDKFKCRMGRVQPHADIIRQYESVLLCAGIPRYVGSMGSPAAVAPAQKQTRPDPSASTRGEDDQEQAPPFRRPVIGNNNPERRGFILDTMRLKERYNRRLSDDLLKLDAEERAANLNVGKKEQDGFTELHARGVKERRELYGLDDDDEEEDEEEDDDDDDDDDEEEEASD